MNKNYDDFDGFAINIFLEEDSDYLAHLVELPNVLAFGPTPTKALAELKEAWELMKECTERMGSLSQKHHRGKDTSHRSTSLLTRSSITS